ncbi:hypothetical protein FJ420_06905 [Mesorhizobium sp. B3-1-3]|uniref:hypothetical protein n=1 Tax=unclassified Mesorhizobium TaxID=325217 RepID=UPI00112DF7FE|nr:MULTISPECIES: hypothetical protein [unclassified Mesorhizobium]TPI62532.1 hypothetical protein FJ424_20380 [Mesorhizobium sp. B3-1-8]TPI74101.1 hypothetical protein FJ420_06905 [Mesorhizobium sp. B3-1-3]
MADGVREPYRARGIVFASRMPSAVRAIRTFPPNPSEDLVYRGGRTIANLSYRIFYVGAQWANAPFAAQRVDLDNALAAAMTDPGLNSILNQYFGGAKVTTNPLSSGILDAPLQKIYDKNDIHSLATKVFMSGALSAVDLKNSVVGFILPPGAVLSSDGGGSATATNRRKPRRGTPPMEEADSKHGLGGYHGSIHIARPGSPVTIYYAVSVWSEGDNGIPIPGWQPWENATATLYHELVEARTDPDVEDAVRTGDVRWIGWNSATGQEIGDFPIVEADADLTLVFRRVAVAAGPGTVPIQLMWSNRVHGPEVPPVGLPVAAATTPVPLIKIDGGAQNAEFAVGGGIVLSAPGKLADFKNPTSAGAWNSTLSKLFDDAVLETQKYLKGQPSQFFNPARGLPSLGEPADLPVKWPGFPRKLENSALTPVQALEIAERISGTFIGRQIHQDEYLEWFVERDPQTRKITKITFTCEGPEYWDFLGEAEPDTLLSLYRAHVSPSVKKSDLFTGSTYHRLNPWNTIRGAMHLIQPANNLFAEIAIAALATILRKNPDGSLKTDAQDLIDCAQYGDGGRASDPHIGDLVNGLARDGYVISLKDPVGLYMSRPNLLGFATSDGKAVGQDWFAITRGSEQFPVRGIFAAPAASHFVVGDISVAGVPLDFGGQVAKVIDMGLTGVAYGKGTIKSLAFPCGGPEDSGSPQVAALVHRRMA